MEQLQYNYEHTTTLSTSFVRKTRDQLWCLNICRRGASNTNPSQKKNAATAGRPCRFSCESLYGEGKEVNFPNARSKQTDKQLQKRSRYRQLRSQGRNRRDQFHVTQDNTSSKKITKNIVKERPTRDSPAGPPF